MSKYILSLFSVLLLAAGCTSQQSILSSSDPVSSKDVIKNEFLFQGDAKAVEAQLSKMGIEYELEVLSTSQNMYGVIYEGKPSYQAIPDSLEGKVEFVEPAYSVHTNTVESRYEWPNDKYFFYQYALNNIGQSAPWGLPGKSGADMKILEALKKYPPQEDTVVAVIDTGVAYNHSDLKDNMWVNKDEAPKNGGIAGEDEDGNNFTDDIHGFDFVSSGRLTRWYGQKGDADPNDEGNHGSHCAGSIAATHNDKGISGVNPKAKIMALRALGNGGGSTKDIVRAIMYAVDKEADIISMSLGGSGKSKAVETAIVAAGEAGILVVAAAGNDGKNTDLEGNGHYPSNYEADNILAVGASDNQDNMASFSNFGHENTDVFAPGVQIVSTTGTVCQDVEGGKKCKDTYNIMSGTSMSTPYVAGVASLILSVNPSLKKNPVALKQLIMATVDVVPGLVGRSVSNGRVNALAALDNMGSLGADGMKAPIVWSTNDSVKINERKVPTQLVDIRHKIEQKGAKALRVHFDFADIDAYDSLYIYDGNYKLVSTFSKGFSLDHWSPMVLGDTAYVRFVNAKLKKVSSNVAEIQMASKDREDCYKKGGEDMGPVLSESLDSSGTFVCAMDSVMDYSYNDLQKEIGDENVFFNFNSDGFSIDKIEFTETAI